MPAAKIIVMYPQPTDVQEFERVFFQEHVPMAIERFGGNVTHVVLTRTATPPGAPPAAYHRISELHFASMDTLQAWLGTAPAQEAIAHAQQISTGGPLVALVAEEEVVRLVDAPLSA